MSFLKVGNSCRSREWMDKMARPLDTVRMSRGAASKTEVVAGREASLTLSLRGLFLRSALLPLRSPIFWRRAWALSC